MAPLLQGTGFITGAASGIGKATAISFLQNGVKQLAIGDINNEAINSTAAEIQQDFQDAHILPVLVDVTDEKSIERAIQEVIKQFGRIDYAVNNAGIAGANTPSAVTSTVEWQKLLNVNLNGVWMSSRAEIQQMLQQEPLTPGSPRQGRGVIVNVSSMFGVVSSPKSIPACAYTAAKHAVLGMTKTDAITYASEGIRINAICPGYVGTPLFLSVIQSEVIQKEIAKVPMARVAQMDEIGDAISFLVSPMSSYMCGAALVVDGGVLAQ